MADGWLDTPFDLKHKRVWVAGHTGLVGAAVLRRLQSEGCELIIPPARIDLREQAQARSWIGKSKPDVIIMAAAKVGGIGANASQPADFIYDNMMIEANVLNAAKEVGVKKLVFLGSSCIYPKEAAQPISEDALLSGPLEPTNESYAVAKIAGIKLCQAYRAQHGCDFISVMPCNLYGPGDTYDLTNSHVIPALLLKAHEAKLSGAKRWEVWGNGQVLREFLYIDDLAEALVFVLKHYSDARPLNIGSGQEVSIKALARMIAKVVGLEAEIHFDASKPDGVQRKLLDSGRIFAAGWAPHISLEEGLRQAYDSYCAALVQNSKVA